MENVVEDPSFLFESSKYYFFPTWDSDFFFRVLLKLIYHVVVVSSNTIWGQKDGVFPISIPVY